MLKRKTICVLSGGLDSTTLLYSLVRGRAKREEVRAISFDYGQRHSRELEMARLTCQKLGVPHTLVDIKFLSEIGSNSALTGDIAVPEGHYEDESMKKTVVPNRNMIMAAIAIAQAVNLDFDEIALGVHAGDHAIYPDCRPKFVKLLKSIARVANYKPIKVYAPFLYKDKGEIVIVGRQLEVDYSLTQTCYNGAENPCGKCGACQERIEAFSKAGSVDPLLKKQF